VRRRDVTEPDRAALLEAARSERAARQSWDESLAELERVIKQASGNGASLRAIAGLIGRSHGRVRELVQRD
jgi:hypothetical protein